ncbi:MAG: hypothetical protein AAF385_07615 [Pseudomonadota bacterium]
MNATARALLAKEWRQHRGLLLWVSIFATLMAVLLIAITSAAGGVLSYLTIASLFAYPLLLLIALLFGQRLVAAEYYGQTQRFIEALPIKAGYVQSVKYLFGLICLWLLMIVVWLTCLYIASSTEPLSARFVGLMLVRLSAYVFAIWSLVFTLSLLGRLRIPLGVIFVLALILLDSYTRFELNRFGPLALINNELFALERTTVPVKELIISVLIGLGFAIIGLRLAQLRDGSFIESLATPLTRRAKSFIAVVLVSAVGLAAYFGPKPEADDFEFTSPQVVRGQHVEVAYYWPQLEDQARELHDYLASQRAELNNLVKLDRALRVRISFDGTLDPYEFTTHFSNANSGISLSANYNAFDWDRTRLGAYVWHQLLSARSNGRLYHEPRHWLLDGLAMWWARESAKPVQTTEIKTDPVMLEALFLLDRLGDANEVFLQWDTTSALTGDDAALSIGYSALKILETKVGREALLNYLQSELELSGHGDVRDWWQDKKNSPEQRFERALGLSWAEFVDSWYESMELLATAPVYAQALAQIPEASVSIEPEVSWFGSRSIEYQVRMDKPLPENSECTALHLPLPGFDRPVGRSQFREEALFWPTRSSSEDGLSLTHTLKAGYGKFTRVYVGLECQLPQFPVPVLLASKRIEMP